MPRGRMLRKKISYDDKCAQLSPEAALLYTWCIPHLDVKGRIMADPTILKGTVFPFMKSMSERVIDRSLKEIVKVKDARGDHLVVMYGESVKCLEFLGFHDNQKINEKREAPSDLPDPPQELIRTKSRLRKGRRKSNSGVALASDESSSDPKPQKAA